jgi:hypothetical protein
VTASLDLSAPAQFTQALAGMIGPLVNAVDDHLARGQQLRVG